MSWRFLKKGCYCIFWGLGQFLAVCNSSPFYKRQDIVSMGNLALTYVNFGTWSHPSRVGLLYRSCPLSPCSWSLYDWFGTYIAGWLGRSSYHRREVSSPLASAKRATSPRKEAVMLGTRLCPMDTGIIHRGLWYDMSLSSRVECDNDIIIMGFAFLNCFFFFFFFFALAVSVGNSFT